MSFNTFTTSVNILNRNPYLYQSYNPFEPIKPMNITISSDSDSDSPYLTSINTTYTKPSISLYKNLNADPKIRKRIVKYFYYILLDKWLFEDCKFILKYFNYKNKKVKFVPSLNKAKSSNSKDKKNITLKKIKFIEDNILKQKDVYNVLEEFVDSRKINWYDLIKKHSNSLMRKLCKMLKKKIIRKIDKNYDGF